MTRPYFIAPLDPLNPQEHNDIATEPLDDVSIRIREWAEKSAQEPTSLLLRNADVAELARLVVRLNDVNDPVSKHLKRQFSCDTKRLLDLTGEDFNPASLENILIDELNALLKGECLYKKEIFQNSKLTPEDHQEIQQALAKEPKGPDLLRLNRRVLELTYPGDVLPSPKKGKVTDVCILEPRVAPEFFLRGGGLRQAHEWSGRPFAPRAVKTAHPLTTPCSSTCIGTRTPAKTAGKTSKGVASWPVSSPTSRRFLKNRPPWWSGTSSRRTASPMSSRTFFSLFSRMSACGTFALDDDGMRQQGQQLAEKLAAFYLQDAASAEFADKVSAAWACYDQRCPRGYSWIQSDPPGEVISLKRATYNLWQFVFKAVGLVTLLGLLSGWLPQTADGVS